MLRFILTSVFTLILCSSAFAGLVIQVEPQQAEFVTANGPFGPETWPAPYHHPVAPAGAVEICRSNPWAPYSADPAGRTIVYRIDGGVASSAAAFTACPHIRDMKTAQVRTEGERRLQAIARPYLPTERETWSVQMQEAMDYKTGLVTNPPMLSAMAAGRGISLADLVAKVLENVELFRVASGMVLGEQQFLLDWIDREPDFETLSDIAWE